MNSSNLTTALMKQASCIQTLSSVCIKRHNIMSGNDAALYGKRSMSSSDDNSSVKSDSSASRRVNSNPGSEPKRLKSEASSTMSELPDEPTDCCMSGCANCVWIQYAEELKTKFCSSDQELRDLIMSKISDPSMKMFLSFELENLSDESKWRPSFDDKSTK